MKCYVNRYVDVSCIYTKWTTFSKNESQTTVHNVRTDHNNGFNGVSILSPHDKQCDSRGSVFCMFLRQQWNWLKLCIKTILIFYYIFEAANMCLQETEGNMASSAMSMCRTTYNRAIKVRFTALLLIDDLYCIY